MSSQNPFPDLLEAAGSQGLRYTMLRDHPETQNMRDLDVLVDPDQSRDFIACCRGFQFEMIKNGRWNPGKKVLLRWEEQAPLIIDLHERLIYRGLEYLDATLVIARRQQIGPYYFLSSEDELLTLLLHNILGKGVIQQKHAGRLQDLLDKRLDEDYLENHLQRFRLFELFDRARRSLPALIDSPGQVKRIRSQMIASLSKSNFANAKRHYFVTHASWTARLFGRRRGALIAFVGPDGCGKSSITQRLRSEFRQATLTADIVYLGPWGQSRLPFVRLARALGCKPYRKDEKRAFRSNDDLPARAEPSGLVHNLKAAVFYLALGIELWYRYWILVLPKLRRGRVVLADRYIYDILIGYRNIPMASMTRLRNWLCRSYPRPDCTILLTAKPEVIFARKPQYSAQQLAGILARYRALHEVYRLHELDTGESVETTVEHFKKELLPQILSRMKPS